MNTLDSTTSIPTEYRVNTLDYTNIYKIAREREKDRRRQKDLEGVGTRVYLTMFERSLPAHV